MAVQREETDPSPIGGAGTRLTGWPISSGLGMGSARVGGDLLECRGEVHRIAPHEIEREPSRIRSAFAKTRTDLKESARRVEEQFSADLADIFHAHEMML